MLVFNTVLIYYKSKLTAFIKERANILNHLTKDYYPNGIY